MAHPIHSHSFSPTRMRSVARPDVKKIKMINATIPLKRGEHWREGANEWCVFDKYGKIAAYPKHRVKEVIV